jgi:hypothetical protein
LVLFTDEVFHGNFDVFEGYICRAARLNTLAVHLSGRDTAGTPLNKQYGHTVHAFAACTNSCGEVVGPDTVRYPLLLAVYDVVFAVFGKLGFAGQVRDVATGIYRVVSIQFRVFSGAEEAYRAQ